MVSYPAALPRNRESLERLRVQGSALVLLIPFIKQMDNHISLKGRRLIGWSEILEGGIAPGAAVMSWLGEDGGIEAANQGHDVVTGVPPENIQGRRA